MSLECRFVDEHHRLFFSLFSFLVAHFTAAPIKLFTILSLTPVCELLRMKNPRMKIYTHPKKKKRRKINLIAVGKTRFFVFLHQSTHRKCENAARHISNKTRTLAKCVCAAWNIVFIISALSEKRFIFPQRNGFSLHWAHTRCVYENVCKIVQDPTLTHWSRKAIALTTSNLQ